MRCVDAINGRSHQLRVHMMSLGHPIVGDPIYGTPDERLMLHAQQLCLDHPMHGNRIELNQSHHFEEWDYGRYSF